MARVTLPDRLLAGLGLDGDGLRAAPPAELRHLLGADPALADWYRLLTAHARAAGAHLMLSKKFLARQDHPLAPLRAALAGSADSAEIGGPGGVRSHPELISVALVG